MAITRAGFSLFSIAFFSVNTFTGSAFAGTPPAEVTFAAPTPLETDVEFETSLDSSPGVNDLYPSISEILIAIDDSIQSICPATEETIAVTPETEEANRLWLLDVLDDTDAVSCEPETSSDDDSSCVQDDGDAPANPNLTAETSDATVRSALPAVRLVVQNFPTRRARLNANVVPQLLALLQRTDTRIQREGAQILGFMGNSLTAAHRATARTRLSNLSRTTQDPQVRSAADTALRAIPE